MKKFEAQPELDIEQQRLADEIAEEELHEEPEANVPTEEEALEQEKNEEANKVFPVEHMMPLKGLLYLGAIEREFEYGGHVFLMRTLKEGEILRIGQLLKNYKGTMVEIEARKVFTIAASIISVDGMSFKEPIKPGDDVIYFKAQEVKRWYPAVIKALYEFYITIETTAISVSDALKNS